MIKARLSVIVMVLAFFNAGCHNHKIPKPDSGNIVMTQKSLSLVKAGNAFTFNLFSKIPDCQGHNVMVSPLSISLALSMTLNGAVGNTNRNMISALGLYGLSVDEINRIYFDLVSVLKKADPRVKMGIVNSIWIKKEYPVLESFITANQKYYDARVQSLDFNQDALATINDWVSDKTKGKIPSIVNQISADEIMFLINAIYFKGKWQVQFDKSNTEDGPFTLSTGVSATVPLMMIKEHFGYSEQSGYRALKMPYGNGKFEMIMLLPDDGKSADQLIQQLDPSVWDNLKTALASDRKVDVWLPRFKFSWDSELKDILSSLGMAVAFSKTEANFSKINASDQLYISKVKHKSFIEVNEEGAEAAAATSVAIGVMSMGPGGPRFHATRPFLFFITEEDTGAILFAGKVENPLLTN